MRAALVRYHPKRKTPELLALVMECGEWDMELLGEPEGLLRPLREPFADRPCLICCYAPNQRKTEQPIAGRRSATGGRWLRGFTHASVVSLTVDIALVAMVNGEKDHNFAGTIEVLIEWGQHLHRSFYQPTVVGETLATD